MNAHSALPRFVDSSLRRSASSFDAVPPALPVLDPVEQMLREQRRESTLLRLVLCAAASVALLGAAGSLLA